MDRINPEMLELARESRGLTQKALGEMTGLDQGNISKYERGIIEISSMALDRVATALHYPVKFFFQTDEVSGIGSGCFYHRKRQSMPIGELRLIQARVNILRMQAARLLRGVDIEHNNRVIRLDDQDGSTPEEIARLVRATWDLPLGPVRNLVSAIEMAGAIVYRCSFGTRRLDAISQWCRNLPPLMFVNSDAPGDRARWNLAHELGHIVMHWVPTENSEREADLFATEFLMPARDISSDLNCFNFQRAALLKPYWKVSMSSLILRAHSLKKISDSQKVSLYKQLSALGYRTREPDTVPVEIPTVLRDLIDVHINQLGYSVSDLASLVLLEENEFRLIYLSGDFPRTGLRVVS